VRTQPAIRAGRAYVELYAENSKLVQGLKAAEFKLEEFGRSVRHAGLKLMALGGAKVAMLWAARVFAQTGQELDVMSKRTGLSAQLMAELAYAADVTGTTIEAVTTNFANLIRNLFATGGPSKEVVQLLQALGLSVEGLSGLNSDQILLAVANAIAQVPDPALRAAAAIQLFGRNAMQLLPMIEQLAALRARAQELGIIMTPEQLELARQLYRAWQDVKWVTKFLAVAIGEALTPELLKVLKVITDGIKSVSRWIREHKQAVVTFAKLAGIVFLTGVALVALGTIITMLGWVFGALATAVALPVKVILGFATVLKVAVAGLLSLHARVLAAVAALAFFGNSAGKIVSWLSGVWKWLKADALAAFDGIKDALVAGDLALAAKILWLTLKVEWLRGVVPLKEIWAKLGNFWQDTMDTMASVWRGGWMGMLTLINDVILEIPKSAIWVMEQVISVFSGGLCAIAGLFDIVFRSRIQQDAEFFANYIVPLLTHSLEDLVDCVGEEQVKRWEQFWAEHPHEADRLTKELTVNRAEADAEIAAAQAELEEARAEWTAALAEAKREAAEAALPVLDDSRRFDFPGMINRAISVAGTFQATAVWGLGAGSAMERTAKATEQTAKNTDEMLDELIDLGLEFG